MLRPQGLITALFLLRLRAWPVRQPIKIFVKTIEAERQELVHVLLLMAFEEVRSEPFQPLVEILGRVAGVIALPQRPLKISEGICQLALATELA
mmetsp:Transcript_51877/g.151014  ORF Transcript_51877/g.151014 Transcript_51877/m.151014 type:complete len:94 (+) Transcript_51877:997-1278(+)